MKRLMPSTLIAFLQGAGKNCLKADLFQITLPTGTVFYATEGQWDITVPSGTLGWPGATVTFKATQYGRWKRGPITSEATFGLKSNTMTLTCVPQQGTAYPGLTVGILNAAFNGLFDAAGVSVYTAYMPLGAYGNVSAGLETKWVGMVAKINELTRTKVVLECADPLYLCGGANKIPTRLYQSNCPWSFCDSNCTLAAANYTVAFTAASGSTQNLLVPSVAFTQAAGYFTQGVVKCTAGQNLGLSQTVALHASGDLTVMAPWLLPVAPGDTFTVIKGCDKSMTTCSLTKTAAGALTNNLINFGGMPFMPTPPSAV